MRNSKRANGTVAFRLKNSTGEEKPIRLDYSYGRNKRFRYSIGYSVNPLYWNKDSFMVKNVNAISNSTQINKLIRDLWSELEDFVADCDSKQIPITNLLMKQHLDSYRNKDNDKKIEKVEQVTDLITFAKNYIKIKEKELPKQSNGRRNNTVKSYEQTLNHLISFADSSGYILSFENIDSEFYSEFIDYMNTKTYAYNKKESHYSLNTIGKHIKSIKIFMSAALDEELHKNLKYKKFKVLKEQTTAVYLELGELKKIYDLDLSKAPHHSHARDVFLIGCEIGQRISDYHDLNKHQIVNHNGEKYIKVKQLKTNKEVLCKITPVIDRIMEIRYDGNLPPKITEQKLNDYIKIVANNAGINSLIKYTETKGGKKVSKQIPKYQLIMGHTARRTFCTLKHKSGVPVHSIMELSGHTTVKEFMKYIRNPKEDRISQITTSDAFINSCIPI